jgi:LPXTG-motif cell wall-anchored protein
MSEVVGLDDMNVVEDEGGDMFYLLLWLGVIGLLLIAAITAYLVRKRKLSSKGLHEK